MENNSLPTICDILFHFEPELKNAATVDGAAFEKHGLPMFGGCQYCRASIAAYNSYPGKNGYLVGACCVEGADVFESVEEFLASAEGKE